MSDQVKASDLVFVLKQIKRALPVIEKDQNVQLLLNERIVARIAELERLGDSMVDPESYKIRYDDVTRH